MVYTVSLKSPILFFPLPQYYSISALCFSGVQMYAALGK